MELTKGPRGRPWLKVVPFVLVVILLGALGYSAYQYYNLQDQLSKQGTALVSLGAAYVGLASSYSVLQKEYSSLVKHAPNATGLLIQDVLFSEPKNSQSAALFTIDVVNQGLLNVTNVRVFLYTPGMQKASLSAPTNPPTLSQNLLGFASITTPNPCVPGQGYQFVVNATATSGVESYSGTVTCTTY